MSYPDEKHEDPIEELAAECMEEIPHFRDGTPPELVDACLRLSAAAITGNDVLMDGIADLPPLPKPVDAIIETFLNDLYGAAQDFREVVLKLTQPLTTTRTYDEAWKLAKQWAQEDV